MDEFSGKHMPDSGKTMDLNLKWDEIRHSVDCSQLFRKLMKSPGSLRLSAAKTFQLLQALGV